MAILDGLAGEGRSILLTSHDPLVTESDVVDRVVEMRDGRIVDDR